MTRGRGIRRRRQVLGATGAGVMGLACVALVIGLANGLRPETKQSVVANEGKGSTRTSEPTNPDDTSNTVPETNTVPQTPAFLSISHEGRDLSVTITDPSTAVPADGQDLADSSYRSQQCAVVSIATADDSAVGGKGTVVAEGQACRDVVVTDSDQAAMVPLEIHLTQGVEVGCAAVEERLPAPITMAEQHAESRFDGVIPNGLPPGDYTVTITGVSGFGDGCPGGTGPGEQQAQAGTTQVETTERKTVKVTID